MTALVVLLVLWVIDGILSLVLGRMVASEIARLKARGEPVSMAELAGPPIPNEQNAAFVYMGAFQAIFTRTEQQDFDALGRFLKPTEYGEPVSPAEAERIVARYPKAIPFVRRAVEMPECRFPVNWEEGFNAMFPHLSSVRHLSQLLGATAVLDARSGRVDEALDSIELGLRMSECLKDEPSLISQLARTHSVTVMTGCLREVLRRGDINETRARRLSDTLARINTTSGCVRAMQGERAEGLWLFDRIKTKGAAATFAPDPVPLGSTLRIEASYLGRPLLHADELAYIRMMNRVVDGAALSYREYRARGLDSLDLPDIPGYAALSNLLCPVFTRARIATDLGMAEVTGSRIVLALEAYRGRHGSYPASLGELRSLGWKLQTEDPFSGKEFMYRTEGKGFLLYSVGRDLRDDGGHEPPVNRDSDLGDIVWRVER